MGWRHTVTKWIAPTRSAPLSFDEWVSYFQFGNWWPRTTWGDVSGNEPIESNFSGYIEGAYKANGIVFACMLARQSLFAEATFKFRQLRDGRPGSLFGSPELQLLEKPWPGGTTADLLERMILYADLAGTAFVVKRYGQLILPRPDWMTFVMGSMDRAPANASYEDLHATIVGYLYHPGGSSSGEEPVVLDKDEVAYFAPIPDPGARWRGMSWMTPIVRDVMGDTAASRHKLTFLEKAATPNMVVTFDPSIDRDKAAAWIEKFRAEHEGAANAYKTLFLGGGAQKAEVVGQGFQQMDFRNVQSAGEVRIAAAAGIHPVIIGLSESLAGAALNSGNFSAARRLTADRTLRPLWRNVSGSLAHLIRVPSGAELWYDDRHIPFLTYDVQDAVNILQAQIRAINTGLVSGFPADSVIDAVVSGDLTRLTGTHTGLLSVQLQPPFEGDEEGDDEEGDGAPLQLPAQAGANSVRCSNCGRFLAELATKPFRLRCRDCKTITASV